MAKRNKSVSLNRTSVEKLLVSQGRPCAETFIELYTEKRLKEFLNEDRMNAASAKAVRKKATKNEE